MVEDAECALPFGPNRPEGMRTRNTAIIAPFSPRRNGRMEKSLFRKAPLGHSSAVSPSRSSTAGRRRDRSRRFSKERSSSEGTSPDEDGLGGADFPGSSSALPGHRRTFVRGSSPKGKLPLIDWRSVCLFIAGTKDRFRSPPLDLIPLALSSVVSEGRMICSLPRYPIV